MIELLLQGERALSAGLVDQAERLYRQAADADPHNSIAVVGLARVELERGGDAEALQLAHRALEIDPENAAAARLVARLEEVLAHRRQPPVVESRAPAVVQDPIPPTPAEPGPRTIEPAPQPEPDSGSSVADVPAAGRPAAPAVTPPASPSLVDRLLRRHRP